MMRMPTAPEIGGRRDHGDKSFENCVGFDYYWRVFETHMIAANQPAKTAIILTALDVETRAVLRHVKDRAEVAVQGTVFHTGEAEGWKIAVAEVGAGNTSAAALAERAINHFRPSVALFVGVAGGVKDVALGDVVVGTKVYLYESGRDTASEFKPRPDVRNGAHSIEQRGRALRQRDDWRQRLDASLNHGMPNVFVGAIAAGEKVVASKRAATARFLSKSYSDTLAVEMEGRGFLEGVHINPPVEGSVIRGISDLLSGKRNADKSGSQIRAADAASAVAFEILAGLNGGGAKPSAAPTATVPAAPVKSASAFRETPSTFAKSAYFRPGETLAQVGVPNVDQIDFSFDRAPTCYMRIIPGTALPAPLSLATLNQAAAHAPLLRSMPGGLTAINKYGAIAYEPGRVHAGGPAPLHCGTQLFRNSELWCMSALMIVFERAGRPAWVPIPLLPAFILEQILYAKLHDAIDFARANLALSFSCTVEMGLIDTAGVHLGWGGGESWGPIHQNEIILREPLTGGSKPEIDALLLKFFNEVFDATGHPRPEGLHDFPPGPPKA
jgi:nucleoside phosphorylase